MAAKILLINPPIYDFAAYDFWLKPYGMLSVAGFLRGKAEFELFDYLDRQHPFMAQQKESASDRWGRGRFYCERIQSPSVLRNIPRYFRRFGLPREMFGEFLDRRGGFDFVLVQTMMTYWYQGVREVMEDVRRVLPKAKIILGGNYVTLCKSHAERLGADFLVVGNNLEPLWGYLGLRADLSEPVLWEAYEKPTTGVLKLSEGCPFSCTYCSVPSVYRQFAVRPMERSLAEFRLLTVRGVENIAFYDDALLFDAERILAPFLKELIRAKVIASEAKQSKTFDNKRLPRRPDTSGLLAMTPKTGVNLHSPNALNARFLTERLAGLMVEAGFKTFYLGYESGSAKWQEKTGLKVTSAELEQAVKALIAAGAERQNITAYQILGHPHADIVELEESMRFVSGLGIRGMLADFSPIPGTPDGDYCRKWIDMEEPLFHNKTAFPIILLGFDETNRLKDLQRQLNRNLDSGLK